MQSFLQSSVSEDVFKLGDKQDTLVQAIRSKHWEVIWLIGPVGSNKTFGMAWADINLAREFAGSYIPVGRTTLSEARVGTVLSYLEVLDTMTLVEGRDYKLVMGSQIIISFPNKSMIQFVPVDVTKDRQWRKIKSINATKASIDEVDGVDMSGFTMLSSRTGRKNKMGQPECTVCTCNPNDAWVKEHVYDPWKAGKLPKKWVVIEFGMKDSALYKTGYYDKFETNPEQWKQRYLYNNWEYQDDENSLFKIRTLDHIKVADYDSTTTGYQGVDVAREGKDRSVICEIRGNTLVNIQVYTRDDIARLARPDQKDAIPYGPILGTEVMKYASRTGIGYTNSACDAVGNGGGVVDYCRLQGFKLNEFKSGASPIKKEGAKDMRTPDFSQDYDMLRSQMYHQLAMDMEKGLFFFWEGCPFLSELKQELLYHLYEIQDKVMKVESKDKIKLRLGKSPDLADAVVIAYFNKKRMADARTNASRIAY